MKNNIPKVLLLHENSGDYVAVGLLHGLRTLLGVNCVDFPRLDCAYAPLSEKMIEKTPNNGFSIYGLLEDSPNIVDERFMWYRDVEDFDLVVLVITASWPLHGQSEILNFLLKSLNRSQLVILDTHDIPTFYPFVWRLIKRDPHALKHWNLKNLYFKRELMEEGNAYGFDRLPKVIRSLFGRPSNSRPISFSFPKQKINKVELCNKSKLFCAGNVDPDLAKWFPGEKVNSVGTKTWKFTKELDYVKDIQKSRFGITAKRAGWDTLKHYEYAANGAVLCFRDLDKKPNTCAPHGLNEKNCIIYHSAEDLEQKINHLSESQYSSLLDESYKWIESNSTENLARKFLTECGFNLKI